MSLSKENSNIILYIKIIFLQFFSRVLLFCGFCNRDRSGNSFSALPLSVLKILPIRKKIDSNFYFSSNSAKLFPRFATNSSTQKGLPKTLIKKPPEFREVDVSNCSILLIYNEAECTNKSANLLEYPISLSYQETIFTKFGDSIIPASLSKTEVLFSPTKS